MSKQTTSTVQQRAKELSGDTVRMIADLCDIIATLEAKLDKVSRKLNKTTRFKRTTKSPRRFVLSGEWSGNRPSQARVCHRHVFRPTRKGQWESYRALGSILFSDGTALEITLRPARPSETVHEMLTYTDLIDAAAAQGLSGDIKAEDIDMTKGDRMDNKKKEVSDADQV